MDSEYDKYLRLSKEHNDDLMPLTIDQVLQNNLYFNFKGDISLRFVLTSIDKVEVEIFSLQDYSISLGVYDLAITQNILDWINQNYDFDVLNAKLFLDYLIDMGSISPENRPILEQFGNLAKQEES